MRGLPLIVFLIYFFISFQIDDKKNTDSPHGDGLKLRCDECHTSESWDIDMAKFDFNHDKKTQFPLSGTHVDVSCKECHTNLVFINEKTSCFKCHTDIHEQTVGMECERCHTSKSWLVENITEIHQLGRFPLLGAHNTADCNDCHKEASTLRFEPLDTECFSCHQNDYIAARSPNHVEAEYSTDCTVCHQMNAFSWTGPYINHSFFPLTRGHDIADCAACHTNGYEGTTSVCFECHTTDFNSSNNPNHINLGLSNLCEDCHSTEPDWQPANFDIHNQFYELNGAHNTIANECFECHNGNYNNTPTTCNLCHSEEYKQTTNPPHASAQFSTDCLFCHTESAWKPSTFDHDAQYFPIYRGNHRNEWNTCTDCHTNPGNYAIFSCIDCHEHNKSEMNGEHDDVNEYIYESNACLDCHPDGSED